MAKYNLNDREVPGGSMVPRFNPECVNPQLNAKLGPRFPSVRAKDFREPGKDRRRGAIGLSSRFDNKG